MGKLKNHNQKADKPHLKIDLRLVYMPVFIFLLVCMVFLASYDFQYQQKIFPGVFVSDVTISNLTPQQALDKLTPIISVPDDISLNINGETYHLPTKQIELKYNLDESVKQAYLYHRTGDLVKDFYLRFATPFKPVHLPVSYYYNEQKLDENLKVIALQVAEEPRYPSVKLSEGKVLVDKGLPGKELDIKSAKEFFKQRISQGTVGSITIKSKEVDPTLSDDEAKALTARAEKYIGKSLSLKADNIEYLLKDSELVSFLNKDGFDKDKLLDYSQKTSNLLDRQPQNSVFVFEEGIVKEFSPAKNGITTQTQSLSEMLATKLLDLENSQEKTLLVNIPVTVTEPKIKTGDANNLGIKELIGKGESHFKGSIANRITNIGIASSKFRGVLVPAGETFSFNDIVGDISAKTGYKQAYVIKDGRTVLGDGGGVCQVSTTLFRAALNAGLPIVERKAHAYRVSYYEQDSAPGLDATVYSPTTDLKILNNTPGYILIQSEFDAKTTSLIFEIYGTSDGRVSTVSKPVVSSISAPPPDLFVDDPTLPNGTVKQIDWKAWGAKVTFNYKVERNGEEIYSKQFVSVYRPWQAVFLKGTGAI